jgi:hypothetical protein
VSGQVPVRRSDLSEEEHEPDDVLALGISELGEFVELLERRRGRRTGRLGITVPGTGGQRHDRALEEGLTDPA